MLCLKRYNLLKTFNLRLNSSLYLSSIASSPRKIFVLQPKTFADGEYQSKYHLFKFTTRSKSSGVAYYFTTDFAPICYCVNGLQYIHDASGLPWWAAIAVTTYALRAFLTLPLTVISLKSSARLVNVQPELMAKAGLLKQEALLGKDKFGWDERTAKYQFAVNLKRIRSELYVRENCHPLKTLLTPWVQVPLWITMSVAIRNLVGFLPIVGDVPVLRPDLATGGVLWFSNLLIPDSSYMLPFTFGLLSLAITEFSALQKTNPSKFDRYVTNFFRGFSVLIIPIACCVPSALCWYWACSTSFGLLQNIFLQFPSVKQFFGIPKTNKDSMTPFKDIFYNAKNKYRWKKVPEHKSCESS